MTGIFITSTGTEIGKTYLAQALLARDTARHLTVSKPIISGWPHDPIDFPATDTGRLLQSQGLPVTQATIDAISPWRFFAPLTPLMAAQQEGKPIDPQLLINDSKARFEKAKKAKKIHIIEGVGGLMSPISTGWTGLDWIIALACPCLLVTGSYLGTLSHTLTAAKVLQISGISFMVVVNETPDSTVSFKETCESLLDFLPGVSIFAIHGIGLLYEAIQKMSGESILQLTQILKNRCMSKATKRLS